MKLGSLFDGSGGFPLAGAIHGITPVWASEIEPYPIRVTKARFPQMKHLGSVLDVNGAEVEPVDIITFGSPCQDLSVAGKQAGLHKGERSNLFFEAIRIIKEMRESTDGIYPRIAIWENVPGAFSSNKGADFQAVLQAFCEIADPAARVPMPPKNKWGKSGVIVGDGWSVAWRTLDAQFWGVPQRRKRIYLIADFGSERAGEILFEQEGLRGDSAESRTAGEGAAGDAEGSVGRGVQCLNPSMPQSSRIYSADGVYPCLSSNGSGGLNRQAVCFQQNQREEVRSLGEKTGAIAANAGAHQTNYVCYAAAFKYGNSAEARGIGYQEEISPTLQAGEGGNQKPVVCYPIDSHQQDSRFKICEDGVCPTVPGQMGTGGNNGPMVLETFQNTGRGWWNKSDIAQTVRTPCGGDSTKANLVITKTPRKYIIRRLTPLECCRLQGFPDWWENGVQGSDSARYKMWGNGLALPNAAHVVGCAVKLIKETQT